MPIQPTYPAINVPIGDVAGDTLTFARAREVGRDAAARRAQQKGLTDYYAEQVAADKLHNLEARFRADPDAALEAYNNDPDLVKRFGRATKLGSQPMMVQIGDTKLVQDPSGKLIRIPPETLSQRQARTLTDEEVRAAAKKGSERAILTTVLDENGNPIVKAVDPSARGTVGAAPPKGGRGVIEAGVLQEYLDKGRNALSPQRQSLLDKMLADPDVAAAAKLVQGDPDFSLMKPEERARTISGLVDTIKGYRQNNPAAQPPPGAQPRQAGAPPQVPGVQMQPPTADEIEKLHQMGITDEQLRAEGLIP